MIRKQDITINKRLSVVEEKGERKRGDGRGEGEGSEGEEKLTSAGCEETHGGSPAWEWVDKIKGKRRRERRRENERGGEHREWDPSQFGFSFPFRSFVEHICGRSESKGSEGERKKRNGRKE